MLHTSPNPCEYFFLYSIDSLPAHVKNLRKLGQIRTTYQENGFLREKRKNLLTSCWLELP